MPADQLQLQLPGTRTGRHSAQSQAMRSRAGARAEQLVEQLNKICKTAGVAEVFKVSSHIKITKTLGGGRVVGVLTGKSVVDCLGVMLDGTGRLVAVEVKHVDVGAPLKSGAPAAWRFALSQLKPHQRELLARIHAAGGVALVLVVHGGWAYALPWPVVAAALERGQASLSAAELELHRCPPGLPYLAPWGKPPGLEVEGKAELRALRERLEDGRDRLAVEAGLRALRRAR